MSLYRDHLNISFLIITALEPKGRNYGIYLLILGNSVL